MSKAKSSSDFILKLTVKILLFCYVMFFVARLGLLIMQRQYFADLTFWQIITAFLQGLRFDGAVIALFAGIPLFLLNIPVKSRLWAKIWIYVTALVIMVMGGFLIGDLIYFPNVNRYITDELLYIGNDVGFLVKYILFTTPVQLILLLGGCGAFLYYISKYINTNYTKPVTNWRKTAIKLFVLLVFIVFGIRGHFGKDKPVGVADVFKYADNVPAAALTINGVFTTYQVTRKGGVELQNNYPLDKAIKKTQEILIAKDEKVLDPKYPLMRQNTAKTEHKNVNIMIVMMESWSPLFVDSLSGNNFGVTPVFDDIVRHGAVFTNAYSSGTRSIFGFSAILAALPMAPGLPIFGYGLEMNEISPAFKPFSNHGYYTFYAQTSLRHSYRMCALAKFLGAQEQYGWEDMPERLKYLEKAPFGYDYDMYMLAADKVKARKQKNFFGMMFTGITHDPFAATLERFEKYKGEDKADKFKNSLAYADWSIGELIKRAKAEGWFDNTIFIFVSDHTNNHLELNKTISDRFHIVFVMYAPKLLKAQKYDYVVSQTDIMPTVYKLAGIHEPYTAFGKDVFDNSSERYAFVYGGTDMGLISAKGALTYDGKKVLETQVKEKDFDPEAAQDTLLALDKTAVTLLQTNKWFKNGK